MNAIDWLLDPAIRWQVMRDLTGRGCRRRAAQGGQAWWGARLLALPKRDGAERREWDWLRALLLLRDMGLDPASDEARDAIAHVHGLTWHGILPKDAGPPRNLRAAGDLRPSAKPGRLS